MLTTTNLTKLYLTKLDGVLVNAVANSADGAPMSTIGILKDLPSPNGPRIGFKDG